MDFKTYQERSTKTFKSHKPLNEHQARILDWALGLQGEVGEITEIVKHHIFHEEALDKMKVAKEIGDLLWYISALTHTLDIPLDACAVLNLAKLEHRHGSSGYSHQGSALRHEKEQQFTDTPIYKQLKGIIINGSSNKEV